MTPDKEKEFEFRLRYEQELAAQNEPSPEMPSPDATSEAVNQIMMGGTGAAVGMGMKKLPEMAAGMVKDPVTGKWMALENYGRQMFGGKWYGGKHMSDVYARGLSATGNPALAAQYEAEALKNLSRGQKIASKVPGVAKPILTSPLGMLGRGAVGLGSGLQAADALNRYNRGDNVGATISGIGALGTAASMIPHPVPRIVGTGIGLGAEGLNAYLDYLKQKNVPKTPAPIQTPPFAPPMAKGGKVDKPLSRAERAVQQLNNMKKAAGGQIAMKEGGHTTAAWQRKEGKSPSGGLNAIGRASYKRETGGTLKAPQPEGGSRKKSFCARMGGMKKKLTSSKTANDPDSRINKALRKWKC